MHDAYCTAAVSILQTKTRHDRWLLYKYFVHGDYIYVAHTQLNAAILS